MFEHEYKKPHLPYSNSIIGFRSIQNWQLMSVVLHIKRKSF